MGRASVPSGASKGKHEALELRDGGEEFHGKGVMKAVANVNGVLRRGLLGLSVDDQRGLDQKMISLDGTQDKRRLGAMAVSDHLNVKIDFVNVKSYNNIGQRTAPRILSTLVEGVEGKDILLVDDLVDQGDTIVFLKKYLEDQRPRSLETAVMFKKPWSKVEPDYFLEVVSEWIVFPFELGEVGRQRTEMEEKGSGGQLPRRE